MHKFATWFDAIVFAVVRSEGRISPFTTMLCYSEFTPTSFIPSTSSDPLGVT